MSDQFMRCVREVYGVVLGLVVVLDEVVRFAAAANDCGWWPSELSLSSLPEDLSSGASGLGPQLSGEAKLISAGGGVLSSVLFLRWQ